MLSFREYLNEKVEINEFKKYMPKDLNELKEIIKKGIPASFIDTKLVKSFDDLFGNDFGKGWDYKGIENWDTSNVEDMNYMFFRCNWCSKIKKLNWNTSKVEGMNYMFAGSKFNGNISDWDVSNVRGMEEMFSRSSFNNDISKWDVSNVRTMEGMFSSSKFNGNISDWDVSKVYNMDTMFYNSSFNGDISDWNVVSLTTMSYMFEKANFKGDISNWHTPKLKDKSAIKNYSSKEKKVSKPLHVYSDSEVKQNGIYIQKLLGGHLVSMTGASNFVYSQGKLPPDNKYDSMYLEFKFKMCPKMNYCRVYYDEGRDLFNMQFLKLRSGSFKEIKMIEGLYADQLKEIFERETGLYLSL